MKVVSKTTITDSVADLAHVCVSCRDVHICASRAAAVHTWPREQRASTALIPPFVIVPTFSKRPSPPPLVGLTC